ncbi:MarR family winged helix-turn-helix transcriptional regulator [Azospirillum sp. TSO35-2]|uniref:MarR family winged helix-turn-helix transcriptional regulator n=1 Tax=Azospirillum sp. TSO35-2 TaxID=716796 RepID=UPI001304F54C|nr:MarR family winged helix-turn-helix transcriptional regulator [Azospirillum sp. TSO35-2]
MTEQDIFALNRHWPYRLHVLATLVSQTVATLYADRFSITIPEWRIIAVLGGLDEDEALSGTAISALTAIDRVQVSRAMARLLDADLIVRGTGQTDRRTARVSLTPKGRTVYQQIVPLARAFEAQLMTALAPAERETLDRLVSRLQAQAEAIAALPKEEIAALIGTD